MESLFFLLGLLLLGVVVGVPIGLVVLFVRLGRATARLAEAERAIDRLADALRAGARPAAVLAPEQAKAKTDDPARAPWGRPVIPPVEEDGDARPDPARDVAAREPVAEAAGRLAQARVAPSTPLRSGPAWSDRLIGWLSVNWFYAVAAAALALAGIFLVQYGMERGLLPPPLRVAMALAFGATLIAGGEWIRRRWGDGEEVATAYLPSVLSGAGVVTLFAAVLGARHLYDLIGQGTALGAMALVALGAVVLGWFHGPLLVAIGLIGGALAPFAVGGGRGSDLRPLHGYFALLGLMGLAIDAVRRWRGRWVSVLALAVSVGASASLVLGAPETTVAHLLALGVLALAALALPVGEVVPDHERPMVLEAAARGLRAPLTNLLPFGTMVAVCLLAVLGASQEIWTALAVLVALVAAIALWARGEGVQDVALVPALALLATIGTAWPPEGAASVSLALLAGGAVSVLAFLRSLAPVPCHRLGWALGAVLAAPATGVALHLAWVAPATLGAYPWALHAMAVAAGLTGMAGLWAARDGEDRLRPSLAALLAVTVIAYGLGQIAGEAALTAAVAFLAAAAAWLDRRFRLPLLGWFVALAAPFVAWRLTAVPGIEWHVNGPLLPALLSMGAAVAGFALAWLWLRERDGGRIAQGPAAVAETTALAASGYVVTVLLWRGLQALGADPLHMTTGLTAVIWLVLAWAQVELLGRGSGARRLRLGLAGVFGLLGAGALFIGVTFAAPVFGWLWGNRIAGVAVLNTLLPAYLLPALLLLAAGRRMRRMWLTGPGAALAAFWAIQTIRHAFVGSEGMPLDRGFSQGEITTYTLALLLLGGALFYQGVAKRSDLWRRAGTAVLGATAAKVFLIDAAQLGDLLRIVALIALAFAMGGLAWLNHWAGGAKMRGGAPEDD